MKYKKNTGIPQDRDELEPSRLKVCVVTGLSRPATGADSFAVLTRLYPGFNTSRALVICKLHFRIHKALELLAPVKDCLQQHPPYPSMF
jgi:hypothetical protein